LFQITRHCTSSLILLFVFIVLLCYEFIGIYRRISRVNFSLHHCKHLADILNGGLHVDTKSSHDDLHCTYVAMSISTTDPRNTRDHGPVWSGNLDPDPCDLL
jgi:hypothetical protein